MNKLKLTLLAVAVLLTGSAIFAFKPAEVKPKATIDYYFELKTNGDKMERTDWILSTNDPSCPSDLSDEPCRIIVPTSGTHPSVSDFNTVLASSNNFQQVASEVTYKP